MRLWQYRAARTTGADYWKLRAEFFGERAVVNLNHTQEGMARLTEMQKREILPHVTPLLRGDERIILDYGCGPGRFVPTLTEYSRSLVLGVDPVLSLLKKAPRTGKTAYVQGAGVIPLAAGSVDAIWVCLVLGGIPDSDIKGTTVELERVLRPGGTLMLIENTADAPGSAHWSFRDVRGYAALFEQVQLRCVHEYFDVGEQISVMVGHKAEPRGAVL